MAASYPTSVKSFTGVVDAVDDVSAADINDIHDEVEAIETDLLASVKGNKRVALADDAATSFTPAEGTGIFIIYGRVDGDKAYRGIYLFRAAGTPVMQSIVSNSITATTGALTGTDGNDTELTVSAHTDAKIYIENRLGAAVNIGYATLGQ